MLPVAPITTHNHVFRNISRINKNSLRQKHCEVVMIRHGESTWNKKNLFCGWYDAPLSEKGKREAKEAGYALKENGYEFHVAFTSLLTRAHETLGIILAVLNQKDLPVVKSWRLNERHYGDLIGLNKAETAAKFGIKQVNIWRRSYDVAPPRMKKTHKYYEIITQDPRYRGNLNPYDFPRNESLKMTILRTLPFWRTTIVPEIQGGRKVLIVAHGNSLRGIVKHLDKLSDKQIMKLNLPTGIPFVYTLDKRTMNPVKSMEFLGDEETVQKAIEKVAKQTQQPAKQK